MNLATAYDPALRTMAEPALRLEGVSVRYRVPHERLVSFKEYAIRRLKRTIAYDDFWALRDITLEVPCGEVLGIIGPNGAGKTTLLKVIARVLHPTCGRVQVHGRVAPLLGLGAGFDRELTGRENVFLNGVTLGFAERDLAARFDRIVEFAGLEDFIDAPLRTYSTGMAARLGFAVATDVKPDILLLDEVMAVGDARFKKKSSQRIADMLRQGTTVVLVSHAPSTILEMCTRAAWLDRGDLRAVGPAAEVVEEYQGTAGG